MDLSTIISWIGMNLDKVIVGGIIFFLIGFAIISRKAFKKKIKEEQISFVALIMSISMALIGFATKSNPISSGTLSAFSGGTVRIIFPIVLIAILGSGISLYFFLRKR